MNVLTDYKELEGKTISFSHMAQFADQITLATTDGEVLMAAFEAGDDEDIQIRILREHSVVSVIQRHSFLREELDKLGIFNLDKWKEEQEEKQRVERERRLLEQEERDKREYERLKAKFETSTVLSTSTLPISPMKFTKGD